MFNQQISNQMKAREKFEARLKEFGLLDEWKKEAGFGRIGIEKGEIIVFAHMGADDDYTEDHFPAFNVLYNCEDFRKECLEYAMKDVEDKKLTIQILGWLLDKSMPCPLDPTDITFFVASHCLGGITFYDDEESDLEPEPEKTAFEPSPMAGTVMNMDREMHFLMEGLIRDAYRAGYSFPEDYDLGIVGDPSTLCGYDIDEGGLQLKETPSGNMVLEITRGLDKGNVLCLAANYFPLYVLFNIYNQMK